MKTFIAFCLILYYVINTTSTVRGEVLFLPFVTNPPDPGVSDPAANFKLENSRLWSIQENGGMDELTCGSQHLLHVHVFDNQGDIGQGSRLDGVIVQVTHIDHQGRRTSEYRTTGVAGMEHGVAEFTLAEFAEVRVFTATDGHPVSSQTAVVSTRPEAIPVPHLMTAGYCTDRAACEAFVNAERCAGALSWNVVFKRNG